MSAHANESRTRSGEQPQKIAHRPLNNPARTESSASETDSTADTLHQVAYRQGRRDVAGSQQSGSESRNSQQVAGQNQQVQGKGKGAPSVRLDMDLDVEIELKAKIQGDLELSILGGNQERK